MADYAISNVVRRVVYTNTGVGPYAFTFEVLANTDIAVYRGSTLLTLTTDYTVIINANGTGSVTLVVAGTGNITIVGARAIQRTSDYTTGGDLFASTLNTDLDSQTIYAQQVAETAERGLKAPVIDPTDINMTLPAKASRVGTVLAFNATTGNPEAGPSIASVTTVAAQSANINTVATNIASVNTVAGNISNVNTVAGVSSNVTTVAGSISNVNTVADDLNEGVSEINTVAVNIADVNTVGTNIANVNTVAGISANVTSVAGNSSNINTVAGISGNVTTVAGISANVTTVAGIDSDVTAVAADATDIGAVASNIANVNTVAGNSTNINTVAGISANVTTVAGISSNVTTVATNNANVTTVAGISANVTTVAGISANVTIAATNVADINNFADVYQGAKATDPSLRNDGSALQSGDLYFNTTDDVMKVREAGAWLAAYASVSGALIAVNNLSDLTSNSTARTNLGLGTIATQAASNVAVTGGSINGTTIGATTASTGKFSTLEATGVTTVQAGTVSLPAITTSGDTNTGIFFPAADTIAFTEGGVESMRITDAGNLGIGTSTFASGSRLAVQTTAGKFDVVANGGGSIGLVSSGAFLFNSNSTFLWSTGASDWMALDNSGRLSIGATSAPSLYPAPLNVTTTSAGAAAITILGRSSDNVGNVYFNSNSGATNYAYISASSTDLAQFNTTATGDFIFGTNSTERMRITSGGNLLVGKTSTSFSTGGTVLYANGTVDIVRSNATCLFINRETSDGTLVDFNQAGVSEGNISVSGSTVSYNGGHLSRWSQLPDGSKDDTILKGTVLTNLDDMCVWEKDGVVAENEQLNKMKVSDVEGDTNVAGVFVNWTKDEKYAVDDMNVAMTGDMIIRIAQSVVVQKGDLLMSAGDGTAKPQGDDIRRSKTVAKVTSNHITCTYADGSYCVPCVLMAC